MVPNKWEEWQAEEEEKVGSLLKACFSARAGGPCTWGYAGPVPVVNLLLVQKDLHSATGIT